LGRIRHFRPAAEGSGWINNPLPMLPASAHLGLPPEELRKVQVFQLAVCNFDCWFCYVDRELRSADRKHARFAGAFELLGRLESCEDPDQPHIIDLSGGQPDIEPEFTLWFLKAREEMGLGGRYFIWTDDNLSTDSLWRYLREEDIAYMAAAPGFSRVGCIKGIDPDSFAFNTGADRELFYRQIDLQKKSVAEGFDQYGYIVLTTLELDLLEERIADLFDLLQDGIHPDFPLRTLPLEIRRYKANEALFSKYEQAVNNQYVVLEAWKKELQERFRPWQLKRPVTEITLR
jgi:uncharacterized Fe-S cluster-containing radical SAM superfamily protein